ncbi:MAG TPA: phosphotransferase [Methylomirabilota bacterium]|nr:phosphotransferase [Methylomirabilota bacterium]
MPALIAFLEGAGASGLSAFLARRRWYAARGRRPTRVAVLDGAALDAPAPDWPAEPLVVLLLVETDTDRYYVPLAAHSGGAPEPGEVVGTVDGLAIVDAHEEPEFGRRLLHACATGRVLEGVGGRFVGHWSGAAAAPDAAGGREIAVTALKGEQSNTSLLLGGRLIAKSFRRPRPGANPDFEIAHFLTTRTGFPHTPGLAGWLEHQAQGREPMTIALIQPFVENSGDGWSHALGSLESLATLLAGEPPPATVEAGEHRLRALGSELLDDLRTLGTVTGELHVALAAADTPPAFRPEPIGDADVAAWREQVTVETGAVLAEAAQRLETLAEPARERVAALVERWPTLAGCPLDLSPLVRDGCCKIRIHGDYHLGQVLRTRTGYVVIDFEGEPARPLAERRAKGSPLRDVAGMLRSFDYAARTVLAGRDAGERSALAPWLEAWERQARGAFRRGYLEAAERSPVPLVPAAGAGVEQVTSVFELGKAAYELRYELSHRPAWAGIPAAGIARLLDEMRDRS